MIPQNLFQKYKQPSFEPVNLLLTAFTSAIIFGIPIVLLISNSFARLLLFLLGMYLFYPFAEELLKKYLTSTEEKIVELQSEVREKSGGEENARKYLLFAILILFGIFFFFFGLPGILGR